MRIRVATKADAEAIVAVGRATWPPTYTPLAGADYVEHGLSHWWRLEDMAEASAHGQIRVVEVDDRIVGMTMYGVADGVIDIWKLYVVPEAQGQGLGRALIDAVVTANRHKATVVRLAHMDGNTAARSFYERLGFTETHREPSSAGVPDDIWMRLDLARSLD